MCQLRFYLDFIKIAKFLDIENMEFITLQFQTPQQFLGFRSQLQKDKITSNISTLSIKTNFTEEEIEHAIKHFGAIVIKEWKRENGS